MKLCDLVKGDLLLLAGDGALPGATFLITDVVDVSNERYSSLNIMAFSFRDLRNEILFWSSPKDRHLDSYHPVSVLREGTQIYKSGSKRHNPRRAK